MNRAPTSHDVARLAGVSQATVSNVLNGRSGIAESTRARVLEAANELDYRPNLAARSMRSNRTGRIAIVLPVTAFNPSRLLAGATAAGVEAGFAIEVHSMPSRPESRSQWLARLIDSGQFEGVLSFAPVDPEDDLDLGARPLVAEFAEFDADMHVVGELSDAYPIAELMDELARRGYRRFLHISGSLDFRSGRSRRDLYLSTVERLGVESIGVFEGDWSAQSGLDAARSIAELPDRLAVIAANDLVATGFLRGAHERGWSVPGDFVVTGWDDLDASAFLVPSLTTVKMDFESVGARSVRRLIATLRNQEPPVEELPLQQVIWRESTGD